MADTVPHTCLKRPIPPPNDWQSFSACSVSTPSISLWARITAWVQLYPSLKFFIACSLRDSILTSIQLARRRQSEPAVELLYMGIVS
jgi:hypothetical protein